VSSEFQRRVIDALRPAAVVLDDDLLLWRPFDSAPIVYYVRFFDEQACKINVQAKHDSALVLAFLRELSPALLERVSAAAPIGLSPSAVLAKTPFQLRAVVHHSFGGAGLSNATEFMGPVTYGTFPAYRCEFTEDDTRDEAAYRVAKVVRWSNWERSPAPALSARFLRLKTGIKSTGGKRMGIIRLEDLERMLAYSRTDDGFVDIENYERSLVHVEHADGRYEIRQGAESWALRADAAVAWLRVLATEGAAAANRKRADYVA
jgi:hypothetical protein